jgi:hypothetical protein
MNAAALLAFAEKSAATGEALWLASVSIAGAAAIDAAITDPRGVPSLIPGGEIDQGELTVRIRKTLLPEAPALQSKLQWKRPEEADYREKIWQIQEVTGADCDAVWLIKCIPWN